MAKRQPPPPKARGSSRQNRAARAPVPPPPEEAPEDADPLLRLLPGSNPYDLAVLQSAGRFSYLDAKTREQANGELLSNEKIKTEISKIRGDLLTRPQIEARDAALVQALVRSLGKISELAASLVPPADAVRAKARGREVADEILAEVHAEAARTLGELA